MDITLSAPATFCKDLFFTMRCNLKYYFISFRCFCNCPQRNFNYDIFAVGSLYGYGVNGQLYGSQISISSSPAASSVTINAGELTIDIDGPTTEQYTSNCW